MRNLRNSTKQNHLDSPVARSQEIVLQLLEKKDLPAVTRVHMAAFPQSALTLLSSEAVRRYYEWLMLGPHDVFPVGAFIDNQLVGFSFTGVFRGATSGFLERNRVFLAFQLLRNPWLITNPLILDRLHLSARIFRRIIRSKSKQAGPASSGERVPTFGILAIAVDPQVQRRGVGMSLMERAEDIAVRYGFSLMHLTVNPENHQAIKFYEKLNWKKLSNRDVWMGSMSKRVT